MWADIIEDISFSCDATSVIVAASGNASPRSLFEREYMFR